MHLGPTGGVSSHRMAVRRVSAGDTLLIDRTTRTAISLLCLLLSGCDIVDRGFLAPAGPVAAATRHEFLMVCLVMLFVVGPVLLLTPLIAWHYRLSNTDSAYRPQWGFSWPLEGLIWIPPTLIVIGLASVPMARHPPARPLSSRCPASRSRSKPWRWIGNGCSSTRPKAWPR